MLKRSYTLLLAALLLLLTTLAACSGDDEADESAFDPDPNPDATQISTYDETRMNDQAEIDDDLLKEYEESTYTLDDPFIKLDPYDAAPLTALVKFETEKPAQIKVTVGDQEGERPIEKTWEGSETKHEIPVLGLYPDIENAVTIEATYEDGETESTEVSITTEPLPEDFLTTDLEEADKEKMENGLTFIVPNRDYLYAVDENADVRWYSSLPNRLIFTRLENGNILQMSKERGQDQNDEMLETDMFGKVYNAYKIDIEGYDKSNIFHHDVIELPNGNLLATSHEPDSKYEQDHMHEIDRETGGTVQEIDAKDFFPEASYKDYDGKNAEDNDWLHQNAIWFDEADNTILISGRSQDSIIKLSYPEAEIQWILGADEDWPEDYEQYLLEPENDEVKFPAGQHAMKKLPDQDGNSDTMDILLFDNNEVITRGDEDASGDYSRAVQYRINEKEKTVDEVWSYGEERGKSFFSPIVGNTQYLNDTGNRLITSGYIEAEDVPTNRIGKVVEVNDQDDADVVYEITISGFGKDGTKQAYRSVRMPLYPEQEWNFELNGSE